LSDSDGDLADQDLVNARQDLIAAVMRAFPAKLKPAYGRNSRRFEEYFDDLPDELIESMLSFRMNMAIGKWRAVLDSLMGKHGLSLNAWHVLFAISMTGPDETMTEIAKRLTTSNAAVVRTLNELEAAGYITRTINKADKRAKSLSLTEAGERTVFELFYSTNRVRKLLLAGVSLPEMELFTEILDRMDANLDDLLSCDI
jgi:MarR family transcriptional regulator for hemolysin